VALLVTVVALTVIVVRVQAMSESAAERAYADLRMSFAPESIAPLGAIDAGLRETSGLAVSRTHAGILWSHNDSGDEAQLYAVDLTGTILATFDLAGVEARDWEAMDLGPCPIEPAGTCLYLADTGDNTRRRDTLEVHVVREPDPAGGSATLTPLGRLRYRYPTEARDAEAVAVSPDGDLVVVTKGRTPDVRLFRLDPLAVHDAVVGDRAVVLDAGVVLPIEPDWDVGRVVTGASFRPDGLILAVRTLSEIFFFGWPSLDEAGPPCFLGTREPQGEAVAWETERTLLLTSETNMTGPGLLHRVWCGVS
jgi:hypothetical protein